MKFSKILVVDDKPDMRVQITRWLREKKYETDTAQNGEEALAKIKTDEYNIVLLDLVMPGSIDGLTVLKRIRQENHEICVIIMTAYGSTEKTVEAIKLGAYDFLNKPINFNELKFRIEKVYEQFNLFHEAHSRKLEAKERSDNIIGQTPGIKKVLKLIDKVASSDSTVLIHGESGTGKELVAQAIHYKSHRNQKPFVITNCAAIPENLLETELFGHEKGAFTGAIKTKKGKCELAHRGTLFLDEIGETSPALQAKLLRFLEDNKFERVGGEKVFEVDVRKIAATNKNLEEAIDAGEFREDLYFRLNVFPIYIPPLRERKDDIPLLARYFLKINSFKLKKNITEIAPDALEILKNYRFPGNVRELLNIIERATILEESEILTNRSLPDNLDRQGKKSNVQFSDYQFRDAKSIFEEQYIRDLFNAAGQNISKAAEMAGMDRTNFRDKLRKHGIGSINRTE